MPLDEVERDWYYKQIRSLDPEGSIVKIDQSNDLIVYTSKLRSDESHNKPSTSEEVVHALAICLLVSNKYNYPLNSIYHEKYCKHGHSSKDEVDLVIFDADDLPFAMWEFKSALDFSKQYENAIESQLFGTAPLVGTPKLLVYATIEPTGTEPILSLVCIDYTKIPSFATWNKEGRPHSETFPSGYADPTSVPLFVEINRISGLIAARQISGL
jgi:type I restriction enzyme M protein